MRHRAPSTPLIGHWHQVNVCNVICPCSLLTAGLFLSSKLRCDFCSKPYTNYMSLRNHMRIHGQKRYMCDLCGKAFRLARYLRNHQRIHDDGPNRFDCPSCCKSYRTMLELAQHRCTAAATNQVCVCKMVCGEEWTMPKIPAVPLTHIFFHELCDSSTGDGKQALLLT